MRKIIYFIEIVLACFIGIFSASFMMKTIDYSSNIFLPKVMKYDFGSDFSYYESIGENSYGELEEAKYIESEKEKKFSGIYKKINNAYPFPKTSAKAYLVADLETGQIIGYKNIDKTYPIASLSKLMTAMVAMETLNKDAVITVSQKAIDTYGIQGGLNLGEKIELSEMYYPLLLESSNDAAEAIAELSGRDFFIANMNGKSKSIGLLNTSFEDPSGLSENNVSSTEDLFKLVKYINNNYPDILEITKEKQRYYKNHNWFNSSKFRNYTNYLGGKNGYTDEAIHTLITIFDLPLLKKESDDSVSSNRKIIIILLQSYSTENETKDIMLWLLSNVYYEIIKR